LPLGTRSHVQRSGCKLSAELEPEFSCLLLFWFFPVFVWVKFSEPRLGTVAESYRWGRLSKDAGERFPFTNAFELVYQVGQEFGVRFSSNMLLLGDCEQREDEADDKCGEERVPEENDFLALHAPIIYFSDARSITNR